MSLNPDKTELGSRAANDPDSSTPGTLTAPVDGQSVTAEFSLQGVVPRHDTNTRKFRSGDVFVRLENTIYGPLSRDELGELLQSGHLTGYESASSDLQHWTPLLYHPRMALTGKADPDRTHEMLHDRSTLPAASKAPRRISLEDIADEIPEAIVATTPLAAILVKKVRKPGTAGAGIVEERSLKLPVFQRLEPAEAPKTPPPPSTTAVFNAHDIFPGRPPHPSDSAFSVNEPDSVGDGFDDFDPSTERPRSVLSVAHDLTGRRSEEPMPDHDMFSATRKRGSDSDALATGATLPAGSPVVEDSADAFAETAMVEAVVEEAAPSPDTPPAAGSAPSGALRSVVVAVVAVIVLAAALIAWMLVR